MCMIVNGVLFVMIDGSNPIGCTLATKGHQVSCSNQVYSNQFSIEEKKQISPADSSSSTDRIISKLMTRQDFKPRC